MRCVEIVIYVTSCVCHDLFTSQSIVCVRPDFHQALSLLTMLKIVKYFYVN